MDSSEKVDIATEFGVSIRTQPDMDRFCMDWIRDTKNIVFPLERARQQISIMRYLGFDENLISVVEKAYKKWCQNGNPYITTRGQIQELYRQMGAPRYNTSGLTLKEVERMRKEINDAEKNNPQKET